MSLKRGLIVGGTLVAVAGVVTYLLREFNKLYNSCYAVVGAIIHDLKTLRTLPLQLINSFTMFF